MMDYQRELEEKIKAHPMVAVAIAFGAGALIALSGGSRRSDAKRTITSTLVGGLGALAMSMIRSAVLEQLSEAAKGWLDPERDRTASTDRPVESFLEH